MSDDITILRDIKSMVEQQADDFDAFKQRQDDRLGKLEKQHADALKKSNRPGAPGPSIYGLDREPDGMVTLSAQSLKSADAIAERLGVRADENTPRISEFVRLAAGLGDKKDERKSLAINTDPAGGYIVPNALMPGILAALAPASSLIQAGARIVMLDDGAKQYDIAGISAIPTARWREENGNVEESEPAFRRISQFPKSLSFFFKVSRELLADSPGIDQALNMVVGQAYAKAMDLSGLFGSGVGPNPLGLASWPGVNTYSMGTNGAALASYSPVVKSATKMAEVNGGTPTAAIMAPRTFGDFADLTDSTGQPQRRPEALQNVSFLQSSQIPVNDTQGTSTDASRIFVGDFSNFVYHMRESMSVYILREKFADTGQVGFMAHARLDQAVLYAQAFTIASGVRPKA